MFVIEYIKSLRFERANDDGTNTVFSVEEPKAIGLTNAKSILTGEYGVKICGINHCWNEVFHHHTKIILVGKIMKSNLMVILKSITRVSLTLRNCARII